MAIKLPKNFIRYLLLWAVGLVLGLMIIGGYGGFFEAISYFNGTQIGNPNSERINLQGFVQFSTFNFFGYKLKVNGNFTTELLLVVSIFPILVDRLVKKLLTKKS